MLSSRIISCQSESEVKAPSSINSRRKLQACFVITVAVWQVEPVDFDFPVMPLVRDQRERVQRASTPPVTISDHASRIISPLIRESALLTD